MQSNENQTSLEKYGKKHDRSDIWRVLLIICVVLLIVGGALAKYITSNQQRADMESSQFHISSDYLEEGNAATYTVADWGNGFDILLYNYEKDNIAQISGVDMVYKVTATNATVSMKDQNGNDITANAEKKYQFNKKGTTTYHVLHVTPNDDVGVGTDKKNTITVTVQTTSPYNKTLTANFKIQNNSKPDYTITDQSDGSTVLITVKTNDYAGSMTVNWDKGKFSPDNTNVLMTEWLDENHTGTFTVSRNSTYELLFFKNESGSYSKAGTGTEIVLDKNGLD